MTELTSTCEIAPVRHGFRPLTWLLKRMEIGRQHRHLARLDDTALRDLGLTRDQVRRELAQPFWMRPSFGEITSPRQEDAAHMARYRQR